MQPFNLFRTKGRHALFCAVPEARTVPPFVTEQQWVYTGKLNDPRQAPLGFDDRAAATGVRFNGYYLFADFRGEPRA